MSMYFNGVIICFIVKAVMGRLGWEESTDMLTLKYIGDHFEPLRRTVTDEEGMEVVDSISRTSKPPCDLAIESSRLTWFFHIVLLGNGEVSW